MTKQKKSPTRNAAKVKYYTTKGLLNFGSLEHNEFLILHIDMQCYMQSHYVQYHTRAIDG